MLLLNEPQKIKWNIKYFTNNNEEFTTIIEGPYYDFIPRQNDIIAVDNIIYIVESILYDFDAGTIMVGIKEKSKVDVIS